MYTLLVKIVPKRIKKTVNNSEIQSMILFLINVVDIVCVCVCVCFTFTERVKCVDHQLKDAVPH